MLNPFDTMPTTVAWITRMGWRLEMYPFEKDAEWIGWVGTRGGDWVGWIDRYGRFLPRPQ